MAAERQHKLGQSLIDFVNGDVRQLCNPAAHSSSPQSYGTLTEL